MGREERLSQYVDSILPKIRLGRDVPDFGPILYDIVMEDMPEFPKVMSMLARRGVSIDPRNAKRGRDVPVALFYTLKAYDEIRDLPIERRPKLIVAKVLRKLREEL